MTSEKYASARQIKFIKDLCAETGELPPREIWETDYPMASAHKLIDDLKHLRDVQAADKAYALDKEREAQRQVVLKPVPQSKPNWQQRLHAMLSEVAEEVLHCQQKAQDAVVSCDRILQRIAPTIAYLTSNKQAHQRLPEPVTHDEQGPPYYPPVDPYQWDDTRTEPDSEDPVVYGHPSEDPRAYEPYEKPNMNPQIPTIHTQPSDQDPPCPF